MAMEDSSLAQIIEKLTYFCSSVMDASCSRIQTEASCSFFCIASLTFDGNEGFLLLFYFSDEGFLFSFF